jgi:lysophospholipase L1-like esterase
MRRAGLLAAALVALTVGASGAGATSTAPRDYYLALGDSMVYGFQPTKAARGLPPSAFDTGYVDVFATRLRALAPGVRVVNYGCPGESTVTFTKGRCPWLAEGKRLHDAFRGSQLDAALAFLRAHPGQVSPITVTLWGNDFFALVDACKGDPACVQKRTGPIVSRLRTILTRLRQAAPTSEIIVTGAWNPGAEGFAQTDPVFRSLDRQIRRAAASTGARVADMRKVFNTGGTPAARRARICSLTFMCKGGDPHPTNAGYRAMAKEFLAASGYPPKP